VNSINLVLSFIVVVSLRSSLVRQGLRMIRDDPSGADAASTRSNKAGFGQK
jgi:hypothetical protein